MCQVKKTLLLLLMALKCIESQFICFSRTSGSISAQGSTVNIFPVCGAVYQSSTTYTSGTSESVTFTSTDERYFLRAKCTILMNDGSSNCQSQKFLVSRDGLSSLQGAEVICGSSEKTFTRDSIGIQLVLGINSANDGTNGYFTCTVTPVYIGYSNCDCGWQVDKKIYNGTMAGTNEFTPMAGIYSVSDKTVICGGSIISTRYVLTAGHCFTSAQYNDPPNLLVYTGYSNWTSSNANIYQASYKVQSIIQHENFDANVFQNDIALVQTTTNIVFSRGVGPVCLPFKYYGQPTFLDGQTVTVAGWGALGFTLASPNALMKADLQIITNANCISLKVNNISPSKVCTYSQYQDSCERDSGGSLYWRVNGVLYAVGIVSYGKPCDLAGAAVATRISSFLWWIVRKTDYFYCVK